MKRETVVPLAIVNSQLWLIALTFIDRPLTAVLCIAVAFIWIALAWIAVIPSQGGQQ